VSGCKPEAARTQRPTQGGTWPARCGSPTHAAVLPRRRNAREWCLVPAREL